MPTASCSRSASLLAVTAALGFQRTERCQRLDVVGLGSIEADSEHDETDIEAFRIHIRPTEPC